MEVNAIFFILPLVILQTVPHITAHGLLVAQVKAASLVNFKHPSRGLYLFGDLPPALITRCAFHVTPQCGDACGVDQLASVVLYDRFVKRQKTRKLPLSMKKTS